MKKTLFAILMAAAGAASAQQGNDPQFLVDMAVRSGHAVEGFLYGSPVIAVPIANSPCPNVGIIYQERRRHREGPRIDNYSACPGEETEQLHDFPPALPDDPQFQQLVQMAIRGALRYGAHRRDLYDYHIDTRRLSAADPYGCAQVETVVSTMGMLVSYNIGRMCP